MLDKNFIPPDKNLSQRETERRLVLLKKIIPRISPAVNSITISGSMAYGQNYSVTEKSDIDLQLTVTHESAGKLLETGFFSKEILESTLTAYRTGIIKQFSLPFDYEGVTMECHFWDKTAYLDSITFASAVTQRLRSRPHPPAIDYAYSFDGTEDVLELPTRSVDNFFTADFQSYRIVNGKLFLCRPITNILGCAIVIYGEDILATKINTTWHETVTRLLESAGGLENLDLTQHNIFNTLPGKNKVSEENKKWIHSKTLEEIEKLKKLKTEQGSKNYAKKIL